MPSDHSFWFLKWDPYMTATVKISDTLFGYGSIGWMPIPPGPFLMLTENTNFWKVNELGLFQSEIWCWWRTCQEHALKINNPQVMIQKLFLDLVAGAKYDYFIFFKNVGNFGLFRSEIESWLIIWPSVSLKSNFSLDIFHKQP